MKIIYLALGEGPLVEAVCASDFEAARLLRFVLQANNAMDTVAKLNETYAREQMASAN